VGWVVSIIFMIPFYVGNLYLRSTNSSLFLSATILYTLSNMTTRKGGFLVLSRWQSFVDIIYDLVVSLVDEQYGGGGVLLTCISPLSLLKPPPAEVRPQLDRQVGSRAKAPRGLGVALEALLAAMVE
jgi:hypothetical protein